uniref:Uncharacterized protein n=1 Tax=Caulerpa okamurae TaxID=118247 RepID=A0A3S5FWT8_9CHLO|nr:hypothetical protein [Caulerpa okamurae]
MHKFYQMYENREKPLTSKVSLPGLEEFFEELEDIDWELRTLNELKHYDVTLYKAILETTTLEDFGLYTWSFKLIYIFLICIGDVDFVKEQIIEFQENGLEIFRVYCDFVELLIKSCKHPTVENDYQVAEKFYKLPPLKNDFY